MIDTLTAPALPQKPLSGSPEEEMINYILQFAPLTAAEIKFLLENIKVQSFPKGKVLIREGQYAKRCYFVMKGCVRQYYLVDGEEKTTNFFTEGQPITASEGNLNMNPVKYYLSCLEDCILTLGTPEDEVRMFQAFPHFESICRVAVEDELGKNQEKLASYIINSPEERYLNLLETRPDLLERVPQYQLASYLGIKPESLSRIRKRIMVRVTS